MRHGVEVLSAPTHTQGSGLNVVPECTVQRVSLYAEVTGLTGL